MSDPTNAVTTHSEGNSVVPVTPSSSNPTTAGQIAQSNATGEMTGSTTIGSMEDLRRKAPKVYQKMLEGIAMNICRQMERHQDRLKRLMREASEG